MTTNNQQPVNKLDEIVQDIVHIGYVQGYNQLASMAQVAPYNHIQPLTETEAKAALNAYISKELAEVIGDDTPRKLHYFDEVEQENVYYPDDAGSTRVTENQLRAEQRQRAKAKGYDVTRLSAEREK